MRVLIRGIALAVVFVVSTVDHGAQAAIFTLNAVDSGWHLSDGLHQSGNENYIVGNNSGQEFRNWVVFDLSSVTGVIISADLRLTNPDFGGYTSPDATETFSLSEVTTSVADLTADRLSGDAIGIAIHGDLGDGTDFGSQIVSAADDGTVVSTTLNANAIAALNATSGLWAIGGRLSTLSLSPNEFMFGFTDIGDDVRQLVIETQDSHEVPEPTSLALFGLGAIGALGAARRRRTTTVA